MLAYDWRLGLAASVAAPLVAAVRTVVMVAHRMRTVRRADRVVFLDGGRIVEEGSHDTLLRHGGRYADFWNASLPPTGRETSPAVGPQA
ncbi:hypothetical protein [Streptomyces sp. NPDC048266]|uniref:hypothetical protein n=1 Tax=Streptomyces sp. NPDC048266 TaxID=3155787 RepID=UPI0033F0D884